MTDTTTFVWVRKNANKILLALIIAAGAILRFYTIGSKTVWLDEAFSIWVANHSLWEGWSWLVRIDHHPPLYYSMLHIWQLLFGDLQGIVRGLSALCSTLAIPVFYAASRRYFDEKTGLLAALILALSPFHVRFGQEARMYALLSLAAALVLYFLARILFEQPLRHKRASWVALGVAEAAVMLTHNTATLLFPLALNLPILGAIWMHKRRGQPSSLTAINQEGFARRWLLSQGLALLLWLPWAVPFAIQVFVVDNEFWLWPPTAKMVGEALHNFNFAFIPGWFWGLSVWNILYWTLALLGVVSLRRTPARALLLLSLFFVPIVGELLVSLRRPIFYDRTLIWATLPYYMLLAAGIRSLGRVISTSGEGQEPLPSVQEMQPAPVTEAGKLATNAVVADNRRSRLRIWAQAAAVLVVVVLSSVSLWAYFNFFHKEEWNKAADYVAANVEPGDVVLFNATWVQIPFEYYFRHYDSGAELRGLPVDLFERGVLEPKMTEEDVPQMHDLISEQSHIWLVYSHDWYTDPAKIIPRELNSLMQLTDQQEYVGLQIMRFEADP